MTTIAIAIIVSAIITAGLALHDRAKRQARERVERVNYYIR